MKTTIERPKKVEIYKHGDHYYLKCDTLRSGAVHLATLAYKSRYNVRNMAKKLHVSPRTLERVFARSMTMSPKSWCRLARAHHAHSLLVRFMDPLKVRVMTCFKQYSHFVVEMKHFYNKTPYQIWIESMRARNQTILENVDFEKDWLRALPS